jgi:hypothetical protein
LEWDHPIPFQPVKLPAGQNGGARLPKASALRRVGDDSPLNLGDKAAIRGVSQLTPAKPPI